jgi:ssDNA-binding replication factor A large subunit
MIKMPLDDIIVKIKEKSGMSDSEINVKIEQKLEQLSGLISKEGAAHIIANELGIKLFEQTSGRLQIKNILEGMRSVEVVGKVQQVYEVREFNKNGREGKVGSFVIGDETGTIRIVCWGDKTEILGQLETNKIIKVSGGYVRENRGLKEVHLGDNSKVIMDPEGETIGEVKETKKEFKRKTVKDLADNDSDVEILGTIVQIFEPRFFEVCPQCGKRIRPVEGKFNCEAHGATEPAYSYLITLVLDDGTDNIRCVLFRNQAEKLASKTAEELLVYRTNPEKFDEVKTALLGNIVKIIGRVNVNEMFARKEFVAQLVFPSPDPDEELSRLKKEATT